MAVQSRLSTRAEELNILVHDWIPKRKKTVQTLRDAADTLKAHHKNICIAKLTGSSTAIAGFVLVAVGFGLSFVTFGSSLILSVVGGGICAAGGLTTAGSSITEMRFQKDSYKTAQKILDEDREAMQAIENLRGELEEEAQQSMVASAVNAGVVSTTVIAKNCAASGIRAGIRIGATVASEGGEALFRVLSVAGRVVHIGGFAYSAILLPLDIYTVVKASMDIDAARKGKEDKEPEAEKNLRMLADELEKELRDKEELARQLDNCISEENRAPNKQINVNDLMSILNQMKTHSPDIEQIVDRTK